MNAERSKQELTATPRESWAMETMQIINKLTPGIKDKAFDPDWFLLRQRLEEFEDRLLRQAGTATSPIGVLPDGYFKVINGVITKLRDLGETAAFEYLHKPKCPRGPDCKCGLSKLLQRLNKYEHREAGHGQSADSSRHDESRLREAMRKVMEADKDWEEREADMWALIEPAPSEQGSKG